MFMFSSAFAVSATAYYNFYKPEYKFEMEQMQKKVNPIKIDSNHGDFIMFSGSSNKKLAEEIAEFLGVKLGKASMDKFKDGEANI